jgi:hypothetical protein
MTAFMRAARPILTAAFIATLPGITGAQNLVANGGFEDPPMGPGPSISFPASIPAWTSSGTLELWSHLGVVGQEGNQLLELDAFANTSIFQDLVTTPGQSYIVSFLFGHRTGPNFSAVDLFWDGSNALSVMTTNDVMTRYSITLLATGGVTRLQISGAGPSDGLGDLLDDVRVTPSAVPEPGTVGLMLAGFVALAGVARRHRRQHSS